MNGQYNIGDVVLGNWTLTQLIGEGSFGRVYEAEREDFGRKYKAAIKIISIPQNRSEIENIMADGMDEVSVTSYFRSFVEELIDEFSLMSMLKGNSNVVSYEDHTVSKYTEAIGWDIMIRMERLTPLLSYCRGRQMTRKDVMQLGIDMCHALELCQKYNIIHRDIKPENIFVSETGDYKLGDFGIARTVEKTSSGLSKKGTYTYMAPEVYRGDIYGPSIDIYSLGIVLYRLLNDNRTPFLPEHPVQITYSDQEMARNKRLSGTKLPAPKYADGRLAEIVLKACAFDPKDRYSSPMRMREDIEGILYKQGEAPIIYPQGDGVPINTGDNSGPKQQSRPYQNAQTGNTAQQTSRPKKNRTTLVLIICALAAVVIASAILIPSLLQDPGNREPGNVQNGGALPTDAGGGPASTGTGGGPIVSPEEMIPGQGGVLHVGDTITYSFTPDTSGYWVFHAMDRGNIDPYLKIYNEHGYLIASAEGTLELLNTLVAAPLQEGKEYYVSAGTKSSVIIEYTLVVTMADAIDAEGGVVGVKGPAIYTFTPDKSGYWVFSTSNSGTTELYLEVNNEYGARHESEVFYESGGLRTAFLSPYLKEGVTYCVTAGVKWGDSIEYTISVSSAPSISGSGGEIRVNGVMKYSFTPDTSGYWMFKTSDSGNADTYVEIYDADRFLITANSDCPQPRNNESTVAAALLRAGESYYVSVGYFMSSFYSCTLSVSPVPATIPGGGGTVRATGLSAFPFIPDSSGLWNFRTSNSGDTSPYLILLDERGNTIAKGEDVIWQEDSMSAVLSAGETYYVCVEIYSRNPGSVDINVSKG